MISLESLLSQIPQEDYPKESRIHPLPFLTTRSTKWFIKREDELGFFTSGSKIRKMRTLIPALVQDKIESAIVIGSAQSNNVLGLTLLLIEKGIEPNAILLMPYQQPPIGNRLFIELSLRKPPIFLGREEFKKVDLIALSMKERMEKEGIKVAIIPEGSYTESAFFGALTLPLDILRNEKDQGIHFNHIFIDAGTGLQAAALILGLSLVHHRGMVSVLLLKEEKEKFERELKRWEKFLFKEISISKELSYQTFIPKIEKGFRPVSRKGLKEMVQFAKNTGVWTDPLYSGRLIKEAPLYAEKEEMEGNILLIHSGGLSALFGFQEELRE